MPHELSDPTTLFFHVRMFLGMVVSLGLVHLIRGISRFIDQPHGRLLYWIHLAWVASILLFLVHFWWWEVRFAQLAEWTFQVYLFLVAYALLLYLLAAVLLPDALGAHANYRDYFYSRRDWFFGVLATVYLVDFADTALKGPGFFQSLGTEYVVRNVAYIVGCLVAIWVRSPVYHGAFVVLGLAHQVTWIARMYDRIH
jgi:hypothetical protein